MTKIQTTRVLLRFCLLFHTCGGEEKLLLAGLSGGSLLLLFCTAYTLDNYQVYRRATQLKL